MEQNRIEKVDFVVSNLGSLRVKILHTEKREHMYYAFQAERLLCSTTFYFGCFSKSYKTVSNDIQQFTVSPNYPFLIQRNDKEYSEGFNST